MKNIKHYIKNNYITLAIALASIAVIPGMSCASPRQYQQGPVSINGFYDALSPYGQWVSYGSYGQVWIPDAGPDFQPYATAGHWVYTDYGWTWMSDYDWGWAPFHYGRWTFDNAYGWMWIPGTEWGPAWVSWRNSPDYYGWAPLGPGMSIGINVNIPVGYWSFVPCRYITSPYVHRYYVDRGHRTNIYNNTTIINNTTIVNNRTYYRGPATRDVERYTNSRVRQVRVTDSDRPGRAVASRDQVRIYRPQPAALRQPARGNTFSSGNNNIDRNNSDRPNTPGRTIRVDRNDNNNINRPDRNTINNNNNINRPDRNTINNNNNITRPDRNDNNNITRPDRNTNNNVTRPDRNDNNNITRPDRNGNDFQPSNSTPVRPAPATNNNPGASFPVNNNNRGIDRFNRTPSNSNPVNNNNVNRPTAPVTQPRTMPMPSSRPVQQQPAARPQMEQPQRSMPQARPAAPAQSRPVEPPQAPQRSASPAPARGERATRGNR